MRCKSLYHFRFFKYCDIVNETWETSTLRRMMIDKVFILSCSGTIKDVIVVLSQLYHGPCPIQYLIRT